MKKPKEVKNNFFFFYPFLILAVVIYSFPQTGMATKPCQPLDEKTFRETTVTPAELIILGRLENSVPFDPARKDENWTDLQIIKTLKGTHAPSRIRVESDLLFHIYGYQKGDDVVLFLQKTPDGKWQITNQNWIDCTPGMLTAHAEGVTMMVRGLHRMPLSEFERYVKP